MLLIYFIIGIIYVLYNALVKKINSDGDWMLPLVWLFAWPLCFVALFVIYINNKKNSI